MGSTSKTVDGVLALESSTRRALLASSSKESAPGNEVAWLSHASSGGSSNTSMSSGRSDGLLDAEERGRALKAAGIVGVAMRGLGGNESSSSISNACTSVSAMLQGSDRDFRSERALSIDSVTVAHSVVPFSPHLWELAAAPKNTLFTVSHTLGRRRQTLVHVHCTRSPGTIVSRAPGCSRCLTVFLPDAQCTVPIQ